VNGRAAVPLRAALLVAALLVGLGLAATAFQPLPADDVYVAVHTEW